MGITRSYVPSLNLDLDGLLAKRRMGGGQVDPSRLSVFRFDPDGSDATALFQIERIVSYYDSRSLKGYGHSLGNVQNPIRGAFGLSVSLEDRIARAPALQDEILVHGDPLLGVYGIRDPEDVAVHCA